MDWFDWVVLVVCVVAVVLGLGMVVFSVRDSRRQHQADMAACQATGRAEWECRALLRGPTVVPIPVVVPR